MNIVSKLNEFNINNLFFNDPIENTVIENSIFIKIIYSEENVCLNGIYLFCAFNNLSYEKNYNKIIISWVDNDNNIIIENKIIEIENKILQSYNSKKKKIFGIKEYLKKRNIKIFSEKNNYVFNNNGLILKISGLWENDNECGVAFKFLDVKNI